MKYISEDIELEYSHLSNKEILVNSLKLSKYTKTQFFILRILWFVIFWLIHQAFAFYELKFACTFQRNKIFYGVIFGIQ